jgi:hypothetical protein
MAMGIEITEISALIRQIVITLAEGNFEETMVLAPRSRLNPSDLKRAISQYGCRLVALPDEAAEFIDVVQIEHSNPSAASVVVTLFTREEGRSDLSLELSVIMYASGRLEAMLDDLHVL